MKPTMITISYTEAVDFICNKLKADYTNSMTNLDNDQKLARIWTAAFDTYCETTGNREGLHITETDLLGLLLADKRK